MNTTTAAPRVDTTEQTVTLPSGEQLTAREALELGRALVEGYDLIYNDGPRTCSPTAGDLKTQCAPLSVASVVLPGWLDTFATTNHAIYSAANSGVLKTHMHGGILHVMECEVLAWHDAL